ncbi:nitrate- and nitrite sensing domain-containing protein [Kitasatospora sp. NPDC057198]|uniref:nitrate- and nitrite sensing domain-containing protein n=1 Tax=Kitasatospora sp. NPDC057198 TaxID=3346046 RepID=UPI003634C4F4
MALAALWAVTSGQLLLDFQRQAAQGLLAQEAGQPSNIVYYNLQEERRLSADVLATHSGVTDALRSQRAKTDQAIRDFQKASDVAASDAPDEVKEAVGLARQSINQLPAQRALVDSGSEQQQAAVYGYYTDLIAVDLKLFAALSHVDNGRMTTISAPLVDLFWGKEMISRSDALLARGWPSGSLSTEDYQQLRQAVAEQDFQFGTKVAPYLATDQAAKWQKITDSPAWKAKAEVERQLLAPAAERGGRIALTGDRGAWRQAVDALNPQIVDLLEYRTAYVVDHGKSSIISLAVRLVLTTVIGLIAVIVVAVTSWRITRTLRRRIGRLQEQAEDLQTTLPAVVERLGNGEKVDPEEHARAVAPDPWGRTGDELAKLAEAFNLARGSAVQSAVAQAEQHRAYERLLQRIARRTQQLIGQQLKKLDELERRHEDPEFLEGLFDLDHLTARLRRYEENLVILAGGSPHRRWRKPVALLDVMRSAQGEVQDYQRVSIDLDGAPWISERAVGPVAHVLAELIENALTFSRPPNPVEVRAGRVSRGVAIEVEDRGLGMDEDQIDAANAMMARPPRADVLARGDDIRLGFYVVSRLAEQHGLRVEFRQSAFGGTRVVVLVPEELIVPDPNARPTVVPVQSAGGLPTRNRGQALAGVTAITAASEPVSVSYGLPPEVEEAPAPYGLPSPVQETAIEDPYLPVDPYLSGDPYPQHDPLGAPQEEYRASGHEQPFPDAVLPLRPAPVPYALPAAHHPEPAPAGSWPPPAEHRAAPAAFPEGGYQPPAGGAEPPLPRRVRQASLVDELRIDPTAPKAAPAPPRWDENPLFRPAPRRAGAAIGAFQRRSREARGGPAVPAADTTGGAEEGTGRADDWNNNHIPTREDRS